MAKLLPSTVPSAGPVGFTRPPQTPDELWHAIKLIFGIEIPRVAICRDHCAPFDAFADAYFAKSSVSIWKACVPGNAPVLTEEGPVPAEDVQPGMRVWSWDPRTERMVTEEVTDHWCSGKQPVVQIRTRAGEITCTANHVVLVGREQGWRSYRLGWYRADEILSGDMVIRPEGFGNSTSMGTDLPEFAGLLLADGNVQYHKLLIAHHREAAYMSHYEAVVERLFGKSMRRDDANRCSWLHNKVAADTCRELGLSGTAHTKRVPGWVFDLDVEGKLAFLRGFLDGDGTVRRSGVEFYSCNSWLLEDIRSLAIMAGLRTGRVRFSPQAGSVELNGRTVTRGDMYHLCVYDNDKIGSNDPKYTFRTAKRQISVFSGEDWVGHRVLSVDPAGTAETYDITVNGSETFVCDGYVVHNSRGFGGKSFMLALLATCEAVWLGAESSVLGGSGAQSTNVHEHSNHLWHAPLAPMHLLADEPTKYSTVLRNGGRLNVLMASQRSVRGPHPQRLRLDEIDEMDMDILEAAQGQPMPRYGIQTQTCMSSTHQYADGTMSQILERARIKQWQIWVWCYRESVGTRDNPGWLSPEAVMRKKDEVPERFWLIEYELQEPSFEGRAIDSAKVNNMFYGDMFPDFPGEELVFELPEPGRKYITGVDWAKEKDWTIIWTIDPYAKTDDGDTYWQTVAWNRVQRMPWPDMVRLVSDRVEMYPGVLIHDATGLGDVIDDHLALPRKHSKVIGVVLSGRKREEIFNEYISAIEDDQIFCPRIDYMYHEHLFVRGDDLFKTGGHPPDSFVAGALAWSGRNILKKRRGSRAITLTRTGSPWTVPNL
jgi:Intein splicing domain/LAGLIDADG-like domain